MDKKYYNIINKFISGNYSINKINNNSNLFNYYIDSLNKLKEINVNPLFYDEIINKISNSIYIEEYIILMNKLDSSKLYKSDIHGINHNIRVSLIALIICVFEDISLDDFKIIIEGTKYHDIGRTNDYENKEHGLIASKKLDFLNEKYSNEELNYIKTIIQCHSLNDESFEEIAKENNIKDIEKCRRMFNILKDSDGLDRARLEYPYIKIELLRTTTAKRLIPFAYELVENYKNNLEDSNG